MGAREVLQRILDELTAEHLRDTILAIADAQPADQRSAVNLSAIMEGLVGDHDLGSGSEGWSAQLALKREIISVIDGIPEMQFVDGDA